MRIGIIGVGGVGGYFGGKLTKLLNNYKEDIEIYFFARGKHLQEIQKKGLLLSTQDEGEFIASPTLATDKVEDLPELDLCLLCVKSYDLPDVLHSLKSKINKHTKVIPLLNGVDIYERVKAVIPEAIIYPACVYVGTHIERYGKVTQKGGACTIHFGTDPANPETKPLAELDLFTAAQIKHTYQEDPYPEIWGKYIFIAAYGMITASEDITVGQVLENSGYGNAVKGIMQEIKEIANSKGVKLADTIVEDSYNKGNKFPYNTKTSFQRDFEQKDRKNEMELFGDTIIRLGKELGIETPVTLSVDKNLKIKRTKQV